MKQLIANYHPDIVLIADEIAVVFKEKAGKSGDAVISGKVAKASPLFGVLGEVDYKFVIQLAADVWDEYDDKKHDT
jgi:hypothetical protein